MSDSLEHHCALQSLRGTNSDYMSNQEKIYIDINDLCSCTGEDRGGKVIWFGSGCSVQCGLGTERSLMELTRSRGDEDCWKWAKYHLRPMCLFDLSVTLNSKISATYAQSSAIQVGKLQRRKMIILSLGSCMTIKEEQCTNIKQCVKTQKRYVSIRQRQSKNTQKSGLQKWTESCFEFKKERPWSSLLSLASLSISHCWTDTMGLTSRGAELEDEQGLQQIASKLCWMKNAPDYGSQPSWGYNGL